MASKVTFLRLNGLLFASVALFVFVISDSESFNLDSQVRFWVTHNCTFPPRSLYEELDSILDPCFENDVEAELSLLCSSLFKFSNTLCTHKPKLGLKKYFTEESVDQKSNITNPCSFAQEYLIGDTYLRLQKYLGKIITNMTSCYRYCEAEESAFAKICKLFIAGATIYKESLVSIVNPGQNVHSPPPVMKGKLEPNETETQLGFDVENASLLNTTVKSDIPVASSIEKSTAPFSIDATPEIFSDTKPPTLQSSDVTNKIGPTITDSQPTSSQQEKTSLTYENQPPVKEIKTTVSILPAAEEQTLVPSNTQDTSTFITSTIGTTQPEYSDNQSEEKTEKKTSNENSVHAEHDEKSTETENQDDNYFDDDDDPRDTVKEDKNTEDDTHNKTQDNEDDSTKNENTEDDSHNKSKNVQGNSDEKDQNMELRPVLEDNQETDQDRDFIPKSGVNQKIEESNDDSSSSSHFMAYFVTALVLCIAGYVIYHNKQKIIAFFLEGRRNGRRRAALGNTKYSKLTPSVEEVMPSLETAASAKNFIY